MSVTQVVQQQKKSNGILGTLGAFASLGGMITGQPWLSALGTGMQGANAMMNGDSSAGTVGKTAGSMNEVLTALKGIWTNPAKTPEKTIQDNVKAALGMTDDELAKKWGRYGTNWSNGFGAGVQSDGSYIFM